MHVVGSSGSSRKALVQSRLDGFLVKLQSLESQPARELYRGPTHNLCRPLLVQFGHAFDSAARRLLLWRALQQALVLARADLQAVADEHHQDAVARQQAWSELSAFGGPPPVGSSTTPLESHQIVTSCQFDTVGALLVSSTRGGSIALHDFDAFLASYPSLRRAQLRQQRTLDQQHQQQQLQQRQRQQRASVIDVDDDPIEEPDVIEAAAPSPARQMAPVIALPEPIHVIRNDKSIERVVWNRARANQDEVACAFTSSPAIFVYDLGVCANDPTSVLSSKDASAGSFDVAFSSSNCLYAGGRDGVARMWDVRAASRASTCHLRSDGVGAINAIEVAIDNQLMYCAHESGVLNAWDVRYQGDLLMQCSARTLLPQRKVAAQALVSLSVDPTCSERLVAQLRDGSCMVLNSLAPRAVLASLEAPFLESHHPSRRKTVSYVQSSAAADSVVCFGSPRLKAVSFWDYRTGSSSVTEVRAWPSALQCHPKLGYVAVGMVDGTLEIVGNH